MFNFSFSDIILILMVALIVFGPGKLPEVAKSLGRGISEFRKVAHKASDTMQNIKDKTKDIEVGIKKEVSLDKKIDLSKNDNIKNNH